MSGWWKTHTGPLKVEMLRLVSPGSPEGEGQQPAERVREAWDAADAMVVMVRGTGATG